MQRLDWDSTFFGFGVGHVWLDTLRIDNGPELLQAMRANELKLLYVFNDTAREQGADVDSKKELLRAVGAFLVDRKVVYSRILTTLHLEKQEEVFAYQGSYPTAKLYELALQSGSYSRFRLDTNFPKGSFEQMYRLWVDNSIKGIIADEVLVSYHDTGVISGMLTLSLKGEAASIGLIAVDELYRGKGLGYKLMHAAEYKALCAGKDRINVPAQMDNHAACKFYEHLGYEKMQVVEVWHVWG